MEWIDRVNFASDGEVLVLGFHTVSVANILCTGQVYVYIPIFSALIILPDQTGM